jgi:uncharacterized protein (TIGR02271 family)
MDSLTIRAGATVFDANGEKLGKVHTVEADQLIVEKGFVFPTDYLVPTSVVTRATEDEVYLSVTKDQAVDQGEAWSTAEPTPVAQTTASTGAGADAGATGTIGAGSDVAGPDPAAAQGEVLRVPVHAEELTATTRPVAAGQERITKDVVAEERTLAVPVTEERARVTRRTVNRALPAAATAEAFQEQTIAVPLRTEQVEVQTRTRVAEEVEVAKEAVQRTERVGDTVRREEVRVEDHTVDGDVHS